MYSAPWRTREGLRCRKEMCVKSSMPLCSFFFFFFFFFFPFFPPSLLPSEICGWRTDWDVGHGRKAQFRVERLEIPYSATLRASNRHTHTHTQQRRPRLMVMRRKNSSLYFSVGMWTREEEKKKKEKKERKKERKKKVESFVPDDFFFFFSIAICYYHYP